MGFRSYALCPHLTVAGNIGFSPGLRGTAEEEIAVGCSLPPRSLR